MTPVAAWLLLTVVWQTNSDPNIAVYPQPSQEVCEKARDSFIGAEEWLKAGELPTHADQYSVLCLLVNGSDSEEA